MKNILLVIDSLSAGGAEKVVLILARSLSQLGHNVHIITIDNKIEYDINFDIKVNTIGFRKSHFEPTYYKYGKALKNLIRNIEEQYGRFHITVSFLKKAHRLMAKANHPDTYYSIRNTLSLSTLKNRKGLRRFIRIQKLKALYNDKNILAVSKGCEIDLIKNIGIKPKSIQTICNPIDIDTINKLSQKENPYSDLDYIVHIGRLSEAKRHDLLLKSFALSGIKQNLILLGDGPLKNNLVQLACDLQISSQVIFAGFKQNPYPIIKHAKLCVLSSDYEGMPNAILDALSVGTPVVSTDCPSGPKELLTGQLANYLVPVGNANALSDKISKALQDIENGKLHVPNSVIEKFDATLVAQEYIKLCH